MGAPNTNHEGYPPRSIAWYTVFVLMLCYTLSYADRQILAFLVGPCLRAQPYDVLAQLLHAAGAHPR